MGGVRVCQDPCTTPSYVLYAGRVYSLPSLTLPFTYFTAEFVHFSLSFSLFVSLSPLCRLSLSLSLTSAIHLIRVLISRQYLSSIDVPPHPRPPDPTERQERITQMHHRIIHLREREYRHHIVGCMRLVSFTIYASSTTHTPQLQALGTNSRC